MTAKEEMVTITKAEYDELLKGNAWLSCLEAAGVDNWEGYGMASNLLEDDED